MNTYYKTWIIIGIGFLWISCSKSPQPISYGSDGCHFCKMTIVDKIHGAELITNKGKVYKFDASECMINYLKEIDTSEVAKYLTNHYEQPENLINSKEATYVISKDLPSPMGAYLTAFENHQKAEAMKEEKGGQLYTWKDLVNYLHKKK